MANATGRSDTVGRRRPSLLAAFSASYLVCALILAGFPSFAEGARLLLVGYGPERAIMEELARAYERNHLGQYVDIRWDRNLDAVDLVRDGEADLAVTGAEASGMTSSVIAWDGIAVIVNASNSVQELSLQQVASLFSGSVTSWEEYEGPETEVEVLRRPSTSNLNVAFEQALRIDGKMPKASKMVRSNQRTLSAVSGRLGAVAYISLQAALDAVTYGVPIRVLIIDGIEAQVPTVRSGRYPLKRPIMLVSKEASNPAVESFIAFARSPAGNRVLSRQYVPYAP